MPKQRKPPKLRGRPKGRVGVIPAHVVVDRNNKVFNNTVQIFHNIDEASDHGKKNFGYGNYSIIPYPRWKKSKQAKLLRLKMKCLNRIKQNEQRRKS